MDIRPIFSLLDEVVRCDYRPGDGNRIEEFEYNGISYTQGCETYQRKLNEMFGAFKTCVLEIAVQNKGSLTGILEDYRRRQDEVYYDIPDRPTIVEMDEVQTNSNQSLRRSIKETIFLNEMAELQQWYLGEAVTFLEGFLGISSRKEVKTEKITPEAEQENGLCKKLSEYGELLSVKDLTEIFNCTCRTISNWEKQGLICNVSATSDEVNSAGRRKRGQEKRYKKTAIIRSADLQEKFNASR